MRFPFITFLDAYLIVATLKINLRENGGSAKLIKHIVKAWNGMPIVNGDSIYGTTIKSHAKTTIPLRQKNNRNDTRT